MLTASYSGGYPEDSTPDTFANCYCAGAHKSPTIDQLQGGFAGLILVSLLYPIQ
jgi:hypothetical protein